MRNRITQKPFALLVFYRKLLIFLPKLCQPFVLIGFCRKLLIAPLNLCLKWSHVSSSPILFVSFGILDEGREPQCQKLLSTNFPFLFTHILAETIFATDHVILSKIWLRVINLNIKCWPLTTEDSFDEEKLYFFMCGY